MAKVDHAQVNWIASSSDTGLLPQRAKRLGYLGFAPLVAFFVLVGLFWFLGGGLTVALAETTAVTYYVTDSGTDLNACTPADPCSLARAVSLAVAGDEIRVASGTYESDTSDPVLLLTQSITVTGGYFYSGGVWSSEPDRFNTTTLDGKGNGRVVHIAANISPVVQYFHMQNGLAAEGAGIYVAEGSGAPIIRGNFIHDNVANGTTTGGGGIFDGAGAHILENDIYQNQSNRRGGGVYLTNNNPVVTSTLRFNLIYDNVAANHGGGVFLFNNARAYLVANTIYQNNAAFGGGLSAFGGSNFVLHSNMLYDNTALGATAVGGGIYSQGNGLLWNNTIVGNTAAANGAGLIMELGGVVEIHNTIIAFNVGSNNNGLHNAAPSVTTGSYNNVFGNASNVAFTNPVTGDPLFVNQTAFNLHIQVGSPARNAGSPDTPAWVDVDIDGQERPNPDDPNPDDGLPRHDVGADEFYPDFRRVSLSPPVIDAGVDRGETAVYPFTLRNTGTLSDSYNITCSNDLWDVTCTSAVGPVAPGLTANITTAIDVPASAVAFQPGRTIITATSQADVAVFAQARVNNFVNPIPGIAFTPSYSRTELPGAVITLTHILTNTGDFDHFTVTVTSPEPNWVQVIGDPLVVPIGPGATQQIRVRVTVPPQAPAGFANITEITAFSQFDPAIAATVFHTITAKAAIGTRYVATTGDDANNNCTQSDNPCRTIGRAVGQAASGDAVRIAAGVYQEPNEISVNDTIFISGGWNNFAANGQAGDPSLTVISGSAARRIFAIAPGATVRPTFDLLTLRNGSGTAGGAVFVGSFARPTFRQLVFDTNLASQGGALYLSNGATVSVRRSVFSNNTAQLSGGAIYLAGPGGAISLQQTRLLTNTASGNAATQGGGAIYLNGGILAAQNNLFVNNTAVSHGGAIRAQSGQANLGNNTIVANQAGGNGGGLYNSGATVEMDNTLLISNTATDGGAIFAVGGTTTLDYNNYWQNSGPSQANVPVGPNSIQADPLFADAEFRLSRNSPAVDRGNPNTVLAVDFEDDFRPSDQGFDIGWDELAGCRVKRGNTIFGSIQDAINADDPATLLLVSGICRGVHTIEVDGAVISQTVHLTQSLTIQGGWNGNFGSQNEESFVDPEGQGRAFYIFGEAQPTVERLTIVNGDAAGLGGGPEETDAGGAVYVLDGAPTFSGVQILSSTAELGGGLYNHLGAPLITYLASPTAAAGEVITSLLQANTAVFGGALYNYEGAMTVGAAWLVGNMADAGGGLFNHSGAMTATNTILDRNVASNNGGGLYDLAGDGAQYLHLTFYANEAAESGGAFYSEASTPTLRSSIFQSNLAAIGPAVFVAGGQPDEDYNYYYDHGETAVVGLTIGSNSNESEVPPGLTDPAAGDFRLADDLPAVDAGDPDSPVRRDFENNRRPSNQAPDMGAHELAGCLVQLNGEIYGSFQEALALAQPGDQIDVSGRCSGVRTYTTTGAGEACGAEMQAVLFLNKNVNLLGGWNENFSQRQGYSTLDARGLGRVIYIAPDITATIEGFDIINGFAAGDEPAGNGAGLCIDNAQPTLRANRIFSNTAAQGGAVYGLGGAPRLLGGNRIFNNAAEQGAGVYLFNETGFATLQNNFFYDNSASEAGGAFYSESGNHLFQHNTVVENSATGAGGAMVILAGAPDVRGNIFLGNSAADGAIYAEDPAAPILGYNNYHQNSGGDLGGDLADLGPGNLFVDPELQGMADRVLSLTIASPVVDVPIPNMPLAIDYEEDIRPTDHGYDLGADEVGGCFAAIAGQEDTVYGSVQLAVDLAAPGDTVLVDGLCRNVAGRLDGSDLVTQTLFISKSLTIDGSWSYHSGVTATLDALERGRVVYVASGTVVTLTNMTLQGGNSDLGGGLYNAGALTLDGVKLAENTAVFGGALYNTASLTLLNSEIMSNTADNGAGLYNNAPGAGATVRGTAFEGNIAVDNGAGLYQAAGALLLDGNRLRYNNTGSSPGSGFGGAVYLSGDGETDVRNNFIYENAAQVGGGVYNANSNGRVWHNTFVENQAYSGDGGGIASAAGNPDIRNNIVDRSSGSGIYTSGGLPVINYNNVFFNTPDYNTHVVIGPNNISDFPRYVDPLEKDYHLRPFSAGEDAGDPDVTNSANPVFMDSDYDGDIRPTNGAPDIGADEINLCLVKVDDRFFGVLQDAIDYAEQNSVEEIRIGRGICRGVQERNGTLQVGYISQDGLEIIGSMPRDNFADEGDYYNPLIDHVTTIIDAAGGGRVIYVANDASLDLNQLAFVGGDAFAANDPASNDGGGIYNPGLGGVTFLGGYLSQNRAQNGGGFFSNEESINDFSGLLIGAGAPGYDVVTDEATGDLVVLIHPYLGNEALNNGGGIFSSGTFDLRNALFNRNRAGNEGGGVYNQGGESRLMNATFARNQAQYDGGAVYNSGQNFRVYHNTLRSNQTISGTAGAIYNAANGFLLNSSIVANNLAFQEPGGVFAQPGQVNFFGYNNFYQNSPTDFSAGLVNQNAIVGDPGFRYADSFGSSALSVYSRNIDQADPALLGGVPPDERYYDHRNVPRPDGAGLTYNVGDLTPPHGLFSDVGAYEYFKDFGCEIDSGEGTASVLPGETITFTLNIYNVGNPNYRQLIRDGACRYCSNGFTDTISITLASSTQNWSVLEGGVEQMVVMGWDDVTQGDETFATRVLTVSVPLTATTDMQEVTAIRCASNSLRLGRATDTATFQVGIGSVGGVIVAPDYITTAVPGQILTFTHIVTNTGNETESFSVTPSAGPRHATVQLLDFDTQEAVSGTIISLAPSGSFTTLLQVTILETAAAGSVATPGVVAQSQQDALNFGAALNRITIQNAPATRFVAPGGTNNTNCADPVQPCATLQYAVDQAVNGDEIRVAAGTYTDFSSRVVGGETFVQNVLINKSLTIVGGYDVADGFTSVQPITNAVKLNGQEARRVLYVADGVSVTLRSLFIENGASLAGSDALNEFGGGIYNAGADLTLYGVWLRDNVALYGAGLYHANGRLQLFSSVVSFNANPFGVYGRGGGIYMADGEALLENNTFRLNEANRVSSRAVSDNSQNGYGGALYMEDGAAILLNHIFSANGGEIGDAVYLSTTAVLTTNYNLFHDQRPTPIAGPGFGNAEIGDQSWNGDPLFTDPDSHISVDSPAVDRGTAVISILDGADMDNQPRLQGPGVDLGADEYRQMPGFVLVPISQTATIDPGAIVNYTFTLTNTGDFTDTYNLTATHTLVPDVATGWDVAFLGPDSIVDLPRGAAVTVTLVVTGGQAGSYLVSEIVADSVSGLTRNAVATTRITQTAGVAIFPAQSEMGLPGEAVVYTHTLQNSGNGLDAFVLSYTAVPANWQVTLTPTQTGFLQPGQLWDFTVTVQIPADAISGTQHQVAVTAATTDPDASDTLTNTTTVALLPGSQLSLTPDNERTVDDGVSAVYTHTLRNESNALETIALSVGGLPVEWEVDLSPTEVMLGPNGAALVEVTVVVPPGTGGQSHLAVVVAEGVTTGWMASAANTTTVQSRIALGLEPDQFRVAQRGELVTYEHLLTNLGNLTDTISLTAVSQEGWLQSGPPASLLLGAGQSVTVTAVISVPLDAMPGLEDRLVITATSQTDPSAYDTATDVTRVAQNHALAFFPDHTETVDPGVVQVYQHTLRNDGDGSDTFALTWESEPGWPLVISPTLVTLEPDETTAVVMTLTVPTGAAGLTNVTTITATSTISLVHAAAVTNTTEVTGDPYALGVQIAPDNSGLGYPGEMVQYQHTITNTGEGPDAYGVTAVSNANWSVTVSPEQVALAAGQSATLTVWVTIPGTAVPGDVDLTEVTVSSQTDPAVQDSATNSTRVRQTHGLRFAPDHAETAAPGATIHYSHLLTNTGDGLDRFTLTWLSAPDWSPTITPTLVELGAGQATQVTMTLTIPVGAGSLTNVTTITATSTISPAFAAAVVNTTTVSGPPAVLSVTLTADEAGSGPAGTTVQYVHTVENTGEVADGYGITAVSHLGWLVTTHPTQINLNPGENAQVTVTVYIPAGALPGTIDQTVVRANSTTNPAIYASVTDTTTVEEGGPTETRLYLPIILKSINEGGSIEVNLYLPLIFKSPQVVPPTPTPTATPTVTPSPTPSSCGPPTGVDLVVTNIQIVPGAPISGQPATVNVTIRNQGTADVAFGNNFWLDFYVNRSPAPNLRGEIEWGVQGALMRAGHSETFSASYIFGGGANQVWAQVDTDNSVDECPHEGNNILGPVTINVTGASGGGQDAPGQSDGLRQTPGPRSTPTPYFLPSAVFTPTPPAARPGG